ncbi:TonB-dependent receptor [Achromobacter ruhlandii]|uniref:TonB-dependent receptor n=1 Tax=Achromobacter ruhlandii TaxID=72557 RepID=UPI0006C60D08|nr:TonB-dependent receptor [Achromobacter ruhlandii]AMG46408.1 TonB-dependent receptor [Achromobacter xylosoxidans]CUI37746.1 Virulence-associated outer membrane protein Vir-90 [Achromobacter ruhlandii]CUI85573.1 Virulence-associated outer membrane protein Vir-90 [Achromobacter ruhlandii]CUJ85166.1 Virulence-associated outer membrane protein Vir-90 [Achromobacter ruhlandii]
MPPSPALPRRRLCRPLLLALSLTLAPFSTRAQTLPAAASDAAWASTTASEAASNPPGAGAAELPAVTVTARRREESAQDVPISMTVLNGEQLRADAAPQAGNAGLARSAPNLAFTDTGGQNSNVFTIRGVGSFAPLSPDDTSVVMYANDVPRSVYGAPPTLLDVDRVEVLRGPQGTLFGRNTQGGAINVIANQPVFDREYTIRGEIGSHGHRLGELIANEALSDTVAARLALRYTTVDGTTPNLASGGKDGWADVGAARATVLWTPGANTVVTVTGSYDQQKAAAPRFVWLQNPRFPQTASDPENKIDWKDSSGSVKVEHEFEHFTLTSLTSYLDSRSRQAFDLTDGLIYSAMTGRPASVYNVPYADYADIRFQEQSWQQELRLSSRETSALGWTVGANYFHSSFRNDTTAKASPAAFNFQTQNGTQANRIKTDSASLFGEASVPLTPKLKALAGLRYTHEAKDARYRYTGNGNPAVVANFRQHDTLSDNFVTGRTGLSYDWSDALMTYATVSRGYVSGGFAGVSVNTPTGKPETPFEASTSWTYELGFKSQWFDRRLDLNGSVFLNEVKRGHLIVFNPSALLFTPASLDYRSKGAELDFAARVHPNVKLIGGAGYTHAELVSVPAGSATGAQSGNRVPNVPRLTANLGVEVEAPARPLGLPGQLNGQIVWQHVGARAADVKESFTLPAYDVVNLRAGWRDGPLEIYGFVYNLFDKQYLVAGQSWGPTVSSVRLGQERLAGVGVSWKF